MKNLITILIVLVVGCSDVFEPQFDMKLDLNSTDFSFLEIFANFNDSLFDELNGTWFKRVKASNSTGGKLKAEDVAGAYYVLMEEMEDNATVIFSADGFVLANDEDGIAKIMDGVKWAIKDGGVLLDVQDDASGFKTYTFNVEPNGDLSILKIMGGDVTILFDDNTTTILSETIED